MTVDDWRVKYEILNAEAEKLRAEVERLREDAARARWCEEKKASVFWSILALEWRVAVYDEAYNLLYTSKADRNAAIDAARGGEGGGMNDHAERLRHMAEGWLRAAEDQEKYRTTRDESINSVRHYRAQAAALLAGAEALERERSTVEWHAEGGATKNGLYLWAGPVVNGFASLVQRGRRRLHLDWHPTLEAARSAAIAWVDQQEERDV